MRNKILIFILLVLSFSSCEEKKYRTDGNIVGMWREYYTQQPLLKSGTIYIFYEDSVFECYDSYRKVSGTYEKRGNWMNIKEKDMKRGYPNANYQTIKELTDERMVWESTNSDIQRVFLRVE